MNKSLKTLAAAMLLGSTAMAPFAVAQDATPGATTTPPATMDGTTTTPAPVTPGASTDGTMGTTAQAPADAAGSATYLTEQAENQISVNDFMGQPIYTSDNQSIGDINDLLVQEDGGIVAAVVGVGGFLGIGQKNVAIPFDKITISREMDDATMTGTGDAATTTTTTEAVADAEVRLTTTETADSLRNAPEFRTLSDQAADAGNTGTMAPTDGTTTSSTDN
ncbi:PRC-barrel domain-containing protein [Allorhizobium sp. NPDC080224]|uniref:PRC-barrel domain containing protein n=1 Tax=Rhizobium rosettiformans TaxID=1368430 RepID=A0ABX7EXS4_9HYPH|nr:PRC-barrel domain-containing protein [Rhizobium rosettiformans]QRF52038.1 PRC-barrel domain containing protein [Rhizobium rosettiformans]